MKPQPPKDRLAREGAALRENLKKRKSQDRARQQDRGEPMAPARPQPVQTPDTPPAGLTSGRANP